MRHFTESYYLNEHLIYGHIGHFMIIVGFISALFIFGLGLKYFLSKSKSESELMTIKSFFLIHFISVLGILALLIFLFKSQLFEYHYIWRHSSSELPWYYILSAIWEGQEGSFILWIFWHAILGFILIKKYSENRIGVLAILMFIQALLFTMILGVDVFGKLIGTNPFILLRDEMNIPILTNPNYLSMIKDGNGLNILLQNYWMVIHPPILFLGFASTAIPFGFAVASLIKKDFISWTKEVNSWTLFSVAVLGTGILMGGRWAYEALSFGGFWAWDPVENASLVPWLFMVAGLHTLLIFKATNHSLKATYILFILSFGFILYSTFLTRSGILGDSSVHSFTDLGMTGQLLIFMGILLIPALLLIAFYWSRIPEEKEEEKTTSKEFWMFMGALFIIVSAIQISYTTSIPVWNKLFDLKLAPPINANEHYNSIQIWFTSIVCFLMGASLWLNYKQTKNVKIYKLLGIVSLVCIAISIGYMYFNKIDILQSYILEIKDYKLTLKFLSSYLFLLTSTLVLITLSILYIYKHLRFVNSLYWGGSIAHIGFGILVLGALISQYQKKAISLNKSGIDLGRDLNLEEQSSNTLLMKNQKEEMGDYWVSYQGKDSVKKGEKYNVKFISKKNASDSFMIYPEAKIIKEGMNNRLNPEPGIEHFINKDIFAHVSSVPDFSESRGKANTRKMKLHDTLYTGDRYIIFDEVQVENSNEIVNLKAKLLILKLNKTTEELMIPFHLNSKTGAVRNEIIKSSDTMLHINLVNISPQDNEFHFSILDHTTPNDWIILKVIEFPGIQILWLGCIIMAIGSLMAMAYRRKVAI